MPRTGVALVAATAHSPRKNTNAAGHNWFIDITPTDNSEFLPTSNPYEWVATEGSAAYGKMDMLSVLLHEYGHALGIDHSADGHDYMATTLTAGVRRLPSAEELALMQQLVGEVKVEMASVSTQGSGNTQFNCPCCPWAASASPSSDACVARATAASTSRLISALWSPSLPSPRTKSSPTATSALPAACR